MKAVPSARDLSRTDEGLGRAGPPSESESDGSADLPLNMLWAPDKGRGGEREREALGLAFWFPFACVRAPRPHPHQCDLWGWLGRVGDAVNSGFV